MTPALGADREPHGGAGSGQRARNSAVRTSIRSCSRLEAQGRILRGRFTPGAAELEWCDRRLLARIHRYTLSRLRAEIEPVSAADFMRFLLHWQHVAGEDQVRGAEGLAAVVEQLDGFELAAAAWEQRRACRRAWPTTRPNSSTGCASAGAWRGVV